LLDGGTSAAASRGAAEAPRQRRRRRGGSISLAGLAARWQRSRGGPGFLNRVSLGNGDDDEEERDESLPEERSRVW
jgi:hypothetical protein